MNICDFCGAATERRRLTGYPNKPCLCRKCFQKARICGCGNVRVGACEYCNKPCSNCDSEQGVYRQDYGRILCTTCYHKYKLCDVCGSLHTHNRMPKTIAAWEHTGVTGRTCKSCFTKMREGKKKKQVGECKTCGDWTSLYENGSYYCHNCRDVYDIHLCPICGIDHHKHITVHDGTKVCTQCVVANYVTCGICGGWHPKADMKGKACKNCAENAVECDACGRMTITTHPMGKYKLCPHCFANTRECYGCGERHFRSVTGHCDDCTHEHGLFAMENWRYKAPIFHLQGKGPLYYGIENEFSVEFEDVDPFGRHISKHFHRDNLYYQFDGSIEPRDSGLEVVVHPCTFDHLPKLGLERLFTPPDIVIKRNVTCGMHVHMTKEAFTRFHLLKFMYFFYENPEFIQAVAGRDFEQPNPVNGRHYCYGDRSRRELLEKAYYKGGPDRYQAINVTPEKTVEVRVFQGATSVGELYRNVEFCDALYHYTKHTKKRNMSVRGFRRYVVDKWQKYRNLYHFLMTI